MRLDLVPRLRRFLTPGLLWIPIAIGSLAGWSLPFAVERQDEEWMDFRATRGRAGMPMALEERFLQLNTDQKDWVPLAANFPRRYSSQTLRTNRPVYPAIAGGLCRSIDSLRSFPDYTLSGFRQPCSIRTAFLASLLTNWLILILGVFGFFHLLVRLGFPAGVAALAAAHVALSPLVLWNLSEASPDLALLLIILIALWTFYYVYRSRPGSGRGRLAIGLMGGLPLGTSMLIKAHYDVLATGWFALTAARKWKSALITFVGHLVPLLAWIAILAFVGWEYENPEIDDYGQGVWIWRDFIYLDIDKQLVTIIEYLKTYAASMWSAFGPIILTFALIGLSIGDERPVGNLYLACLLVIVVNLTFLFAIRRPFPYLVSEVFVIVYPLAAVGLDAVLRRLGNVAFSPAATLYLFIATIAAWVFSKPAAYAWSFFG